MTELPSDFNFSAPPGGGRPDRANKRVVAAHFDEPIYRRLKVLLAQRGWTTQGGLSYAVHLLFEHCEPKEKAPDG